MRQQGLDSYPTGMWSTTDANKSRSALDSRSRLALRPQPVARILVRFAPDRTLGVHRTPSLGSPQSPQQSIPTEQLFLEMRVGATQSLSNLAAQQVQPTPPADAHEWRCSVI